MSNRRQFLRTLFTAAAAAPVLGKVLANLPANLPEKVANPAWKSVPYEVGYALSPDTAKRWGFNPQLYVGELKWHHYPDGFTAQLDNSPLRYSIHKFHEPSRIS